MVATSGDGDILIKITGDDSSLNAASLRGIKSLDALENKAKQTSSVMGQLQSVIGKLGIVLGTAAIVKYADSWSELNARLINATGSMEKGAAVMSRLQEMSRRTYSSVKQTTESFIQNSFALDAVGLSTKTQLNLLETLNNALVVSATRQDRAEATMLAWTRAMDLGQLSGMNLNTVLMNSERLAKALADSMGVSINQLRKLGSEGKITTEVMVGITSQMEKLRAEAEAMPATIADGFTLLNDAVFTVVGSLDRATGSSSGLAEILVKLSDAIKGSSDTISTLAILIKNALGDALSSISGAFGGMVSEADAASAAMVVGFSAAAAASARLAVALSVQVVGAIRAVTVAMLTNPLGLFVAGVAAAITAAYLFRDKIQQAIGVDVINIMKQSVNWVIGYWKTCFETIKMIWDRFPAIMKDAAVQGANAFISAIEWMVNKVLQGFNQIIQGVNAIASALGSEFVASSLGTGSGQISLFKALELDRIQNEAPGTLKKLSEDIQNAFANNTAKDYVGELTSTLGGMWEAASKANQEAKGLMSTLDGTDNPNYPAVDDKEKSDKAKALKEKMDTALEALREYLRNEEESENASYETRLEELKAFWEARMITEQEYHEMVEQLTKKHEENLVKIRRDAMRKEHQERTKMTSDVKSALQSISSVMDSEGDKQIGIQKAVSLAIAAINVAEGISKALTLPFPANLAAAAATAAQGFAAIASIRSTSRGNSGTLGGGGATFTPEVTAPTVDPGVPQSIYIEGIDKDSWYSGDSIMKIIDGINGAVNNGAVIRTKPI